MRVYFWLVAGERACGCGGTFSCQIPLFPFLVYYLIMPRSRFYILQKRKQRKETCIYLADVVSFTGTFFLSHSFHQISVCAAKTLPPLLTFLGQLIFWCEMLPGRGLVTTVCREN